MIKVMKHINNYFTKSIEYGIYEIETDGITGSFSDTYVAGAYLIIQNSYLNDGIYKILSVTNSKITLDATLIAEDTESTMLIALSTPPSDFVTLATTILSYTEKGLGVKSESLDDYSVSYDNDGSWQSVYKNKLNDYRKVYSDLL